MRKKEKIPTLNQDFELETLMTVLKKNLIFVIAFFFIAVCCGYIYFRYTQPTYSSSSIIQIKKENKTREILGISEEVKMEPTIEIMRSEEFLKTVIKNLPLGISFFTEGAFLTNESYGTIPININYEISESNIYDTPIYYERNSDGKSYDISIGNNAPLHNIPYGEKIKLPEGLTITMSAPTSSYIEKSSIKDKYYFTINSERKTIREISSGLNITALNASAGTIQITYDCYNANKSADIANAIAEQYIEFDIMKNRESSLSTIAYIDEQMDNMADELSTIENQLQQFRLANGITNEDAISHRNSLAEAKISNIEQRTAEIEFEIETLDEVKKELKDNPDLNVYEIMAMMSGQSSNSFISSMLQSLQDLITKRELMLFEVTETNHKIVVIDKQIQTKKESIIDFIGSTRTRLEKQMQEYKEKEKNIRNGIFERNEYDELEYSKLQRVYSINEEYYSQLLKTKADILISQSGFVSTNIVLERASAPCTPISPILSKTITMSIILALVLSILFLLARYLFYNKILSTNDITKYTEVPVIGEIVSSRHKMPTSKAIVHKNARSHITENFRKIRTNLDYYPLESRSRVIITTSTIPGEGKTFVAINTGVIYAMSGKKVLIVDFDLRKPRLDQCFELENEYGVSSILTNRKNWHECIHKDVIENADVITSGPITPISAELLTSKNLGTFISEIREEYDIIILDTPPIGIIHDAITLSKYSDNIFYIMRHGISVKGYIGYMNGLKDEHDIKNISIVLNGVPISNKGGYGYGKYGYGYSCDDSDEDTKETNLFKKLFKKN